MMHYYKKNIGDYHKKAGRLSMLQHGAYTLLLDSCYDREIFPTLEQAIEWSWAGSRDEIEAVEFVLSRFFALEEGVYVQKRIQVELDKFHETSATNKRIAQERETKRKKKATKRAPSVDVPPPNHKPLTTNQEPLTNNQGKSKDLSAKADDDQQIALTDLDSYAMTVSQGSDPVMEIFNYWLDTMKKKSNTALSTERKAKIKKRLKDGYSISDIKTAIFNCSNTDHNMGRGKNSNGTKYNDIELICRNSVNLERFRDNPGEGGSDTKRDADISAWVNGDDKQPLNTGETFEHERF